MEEEEKSDDDKGLLRKKVFGHKVSWPTRRKWLRDMGLWDNTKLQEEIEKCYGRFHKLRYVMLPEGRTWPELLQALLKYESCFASGWFDIRMVDNLPEKFSLKYEEGSQLLRAKVKHYEAGAR